MTTRLLLLASLFAAALPAACSGTTIGTGTEGQGIPGTGAPSGNDSGVGSYVESGAAVPDGSAAASSSEYDALFGKPATTTATADSLEGLWAGTMSDTNDDVRLKIGSDAIVIAVRCETGSASTVTFGVEVSAVVTASSIRLLESKTVGTWCKLSVRPQTLPRCGSQFECFEVKGTTLRFSSSAALFSSEAGLSSGPNSLFTKISD